MTAAPTGVCDSGRSVPRLVKSPREPLFSPVMRRMDFRANGIFMAMNTPARVTRIMPALAPCVTAFDAIQTIVRIIGQRDAVEEGFYPVLVGLFERSTCSSCRGSSADHFPARLHRRMAIQVDRGRRQFAIIDDIIIRDLRCLVGRWLLPQLNIHLGPGIVAGIFNATFVADSGRLSALFRSTPASITGSMFNDT